MNTRQRWVVHLDMDAFFASVEQLTRPTLAGRPVLVGGASGRGVVAGASYESRVYGARSAMPMQQAVRLCRGKAVVVTPRFAVYSAVSAQVFELLGREGDTVEQLSVDEGFVEPESLAGRSPQEVEGWARELQARVDDEVGLPCSIGVASTKLDAKMASDLAKPHGVTVVGVERRAEVFATRPVGELWGIGPVAQNKLAEVGVTTIGDFTDMDDVDVKGLLGSVGLQVQGYARGQDSRPVAPRARAKQVSAERTLETDATTTADVDPVLVRAATAARDRLLGDGRAARTVTVKTRTADFKAHTRSTTLITPTDDVDEIIAAARSVVPRPEVSGAVRLVGVSLSGLTEERQAVLFPESGVADLEAEVTTAPEINDVADETTGQQDEDHDMQPTSWRPTVDVHHAEFGHGWVQGTGAGVVSIRFETRSTGPGKARSLAVDDPALRPADPLDSLR
ncbi:MAG: DNA polymerase IV [Corynebacterium sp.]|uniref:DNA polymerase IV n=1 Tax=unclassified Corynebacterium TaxID=2624378 RepID=UPI00096A7545|nr:DNA polymerase IV [Corynebacterium sp. CNJ-954]